MASSSPLIRFGTTGVAAGIMLAGVGGAASGAVSAAALTPPEWSFEVIHTDAKPVEYRPAGIDAQAAAKPVCPKEAAIAYYTRTWWCGTGTDKVIVLHNGKPAGSIYMWTNVKKVLDVKSRDSTETIWFDHIKTTGAGSGFTLRFQAACQTGCSSTVKFPQLKPVRTGGKISGTVNYRYVDNKTRTFKNKYTITMLKPGYTPAVIYSASADWRCDNAFGKRQRAGCIVPSFTPTLDMTPLKFISAGIRRIWGNSPNRYGQKGSGHPLHYLANDKKANDNRTAVCGGKKPPIILPPDWPQGETPSCDEYPLAHSKEGGTALNARDRGIEVFSAKLIRTVGPSEAEMVTSGQTRGRIAVAGNRRGATGRRGLAKDRLRCRKAPRDLVSCHARRPA